MIAFQAASLALFYPRAVGPGLGILAPLALKIGQTANHLGTQARSESPSHLQAPARHLTNARNRPCPTRARIPPAVVRNAPHPRGRPLHSACACNAVECSRAP